ncbi:tetratricopeptide repeat protein [Hymenobacter gummosus]|uniref:Tetratricopeptide repeat protein n=1 Tax=Hymenobacter gummosus TaxID=1776032 RepID=A0A431TZT9_9BACT|nr:tetratricopeptide repeat protein [Hymenobacter gummosus]RTQ47878.1 tetratricopeptide repeat protein [Hymenobacter gummosus]
MKYLLTVAGCLLALTSLHAQSTVDKVAARTCDCLGAVASPDSLQQRLRRCAPLAMGQVLESGTAADKQLISTVDGMQSTYRRLYQLLPEMCPAVAKLTAGAPLSAPEPEGKAKQDKYYRLSDSREANKFYQEGNALREKKNYKGAIKQYEKALALEPQFVYALDHLAISHRQLGHYDEARATYDRSLAIYPEGDVALLNQAVVYSLLKDWDNARKYYGLLQRAHPDNPEGYFGLGKLALLSEDHEAAMTNLFKVHRLYVDAKSAYVSDSQQLLVMLYAQMQKTGKIERFLARAKDYGISFEVKD